MQREGIFREMKQRRAYEKPSERKTREKAEAIRRARKAARKQAQREGLLPMPKRKIDEARGRGRPGGFGGGRRRLHVPHVTAIGQPFEPVAPLIGDGVKM